MTSTFVMMDCPKCKRVFQWDVITEKICKDCSEVHGDNLRSILDGMKKRNFSGQETIIHALTLLLDRIELLESIPKPSSKK